MGMLSYGPMPGRVLENTRAQIALMRPDPQTTAMRQIVAELLITYRSRGRVGVAGACGEGPRGALDAVRPDGCIAWAGRDGGPHPALERWFSAP
ncbi:MULTISPECIES: hypothetical protein [Corallococcus]|uniref:hypothetical protein n=1 Tax=Corallococcus TaxID=83461 RepID=UPI0011C49BA2|nr:MULTISPECIES: hypothetical protein [Corallococcus]